MSRSLRFALALSVLLPPALAARAQDTGLPEPFSPWLENKPYPDEYKRAYLPGQDGDAERILPRPKEQVEEAAKIANAHEFIMASEEGYDTNIGDRGGRLSGGRSRRSGRSACAGPAA